MLNDRRAGDEYYAILIRVAEPRNRCFVAMPFSDDLESVYATIERAANQLGLQAFRTKDIQEKQEFTQDIFAEIQAARLVVGVCTAEAATQKPNPNVMYEVGFAHALGKPTLLMTADSQSLPADIRNIYTLTYDPVDTSTADLRRNRELVMRIRLEMQQRLDRSHENLIDKAWGERVSVARNRHRMFLDTEFWDNFRSILDLGKTVHDEMQGIDTAQINPLLAEAESVYASDSVQRTRVVSLVKAFGSYKFYYDTVTRQHLFEHLPARRSETDAAFDYLLKNSDANLQARIKTAQGFWEEIKLLLDEDKQDSYPYLHDAIVDCIKGDLIVSLQQGQNRVSDIYQYIKGLSDSTKTIIIQADRLIVNLIGIMM